MQKLYKLIEVLLLLMIGLPAFLGILLLLQATGDVLWSEKASGWAQTIGAVAAIYFSHRLGLKQGEDALKAVHAADKIAAKRKFDSVLAVVDSARGYAEEVSVAFNGDQVNYLMLHIKYSEKLMQDLIDSLQVIPAHELGSYEAVSSLLSLRTAMNHFRGNVERAKARFDQIGRDEGGIPHTIKHDSTALRLCIRQIDHYASNLYEVRAAALN